MNTFVKSFKIFVCALRLFNSVGQLVAVHDKSIFLAPFKLAVMVMRDSKQMHNFMSHDNRCVEWGLHILDNAPCQSLVLVTN